MSRAPLISSAVSFLSDPSTSSSPLAKRIAFLEAKGLTPQEIEQAFALVNGGGAGPRFGGGMQGRREFERDWRDWFIMGVVGGAVGWVAVTLAKKYLIPHLQPPSQTELEAAQSALEAKYDEAALLLRTLQTSTDALATSLDEQKAEVEKELAEVRKAVLEMREGEKKREEWSKVIGEKVEEVVKGLPAMLEKQSHSSVQSLTDLQVELKSLKSLLIARRPVSVSSSTSPSTSTPLSPSLPYTNTGLSDLPPSTTRTSSFPARTPGIPAWQMKSSSSTLAAGAPTTSGSSMTANATPFVTATPLVANEETAKVVTVEDPSASGVLVNKEDAIVGAEEKVGEEVKTA